jgi:hypothetical protein
LPGLDGKVEVIQFLDECLPLAGNSLRERNSPAE